MELSLIFILVLCCQPASVSSVNYNTPSHDPPALVKTLLTLEHYNDFIDICQTCVEVRECVPKMSKFCEYANCTLFLTDIGYYLSYFLCDDNRDCLVGGSRCLSNRCYCKLTCLAMIKLLSSQARAKRATAMNSAHIFNRCLRNFRISPTSG